MKSPKENDTFQSMHEKRLHNASIPATHVARLKPVRQRQVDEVDP